MSNLQNQNNITTKNREWFEIWFNEHYQVIYPNRDKKQAAQQVELVLAEARLLHLPSPLTKRWNILDLACGDGRHLLGFKQDSNSLPTSPQKKDAPFVSGMDLSDTLLGVAQKAQCPLVRGDMRALPYKENSFAIVSCFFSSFGYFENETEDEDSLKAIAGLIQPGGFLFLDLVNKQPLIENLVDRDEKEVGGYQVIQKRQLKGDRIYKTITLKPLTQVEKLSKISSTLEYQEKLRLYTHDKIKAMAKKYRLVWIKTLGDEQGAYYTEKLSPRMSLFFKKASE